MTLRQKIIFLPACGAMCLVLVLTVFGDNGLVELKRLRARHADLVVANERLKQENLQMYRAIERLQNDPAFIENVARRELGMIRSDELIFKFATEQPEP